MLGSGTAGAFLFLPTPPHLWHRARNSGVVPSFLAPAPYLWPRALYVYLLSVSVSRKWTTTFRQKRTKMPILCSKCLKTGVPKVKKAQKWSFCARNARKLRLRRPKKHKNLDFVLERPENEGLEGQKSTKTPILCLKGLKMGVLEAKKAQKWSFCAREEGNWNREERKLASGSITAETLIVNVAFLQITAHALKT